MNTTENTTLPETPANIGEPTQNEIDNLFISLVDQPELLYYLQTLVLEDMKSLEDLAHVQQERVLLDYDRLPVAPEFVDSLFEDVSKCLTACLEKLNAPIRVINLVGDLDSLRYYMHLAYVDPHTIDPTKFDGAWAILECINNLAACGCVFKGAYTESLPRPGTFLAEDK